MSDRVSPWRDWNVVSYVLDCYEGVELVERASGVRQRVRQFMWAEADGEVWIGNSAAFAEHVARRFRYEHKTYDYVAINSILIDAGERILDRVERTATGARADQPPLQPQKERAS
jgi:hypothetical protein